MTNTSTYVEAGSQNNSTEALCSRIPYKFYSDPALYTREQERIFCGSSWNYVGLSTEIPNRGDFKRATIGDKPVIVVRDKDASINVFTNKCTHRGAELCMQNFGSVTSFQCPYHQWTFDIKGNLRGVSFEKGLNGHGGMPADFDLKAHSLHKLKVAERNGVIFASFDPKIEPFEEYLGSSMLHYFDRVFDGRKLRVLGYSRQLISSNWKLIFENIKDPYHATTLHVFFVTFGLWRADQRSEVRIDKTGRHACLISCKGEQASSTVKTQTKSFIADLKLQGPHLLDAVREFPDYATCIMQTIYPNVIIQQQLNCLATRQIVTRSPEAFELIWTFFGYADDTPEMTKLRLRQANLVGPAGYVSIDDSEVMRSIQNAVSSYDTGDTVLEMGGRRCHDEEHMLTEAAIRAFYKYYRDIMEA